MASIQEPNDVNLRAEDAAAFPRLTIGNRDWCQTELADALVEERLTAAERKMVSDYLWTIGFKTVKKQLRTGELARSSQTMGRPIEWKFDDQRLLQESEELRDELAAEVMLVAVPYFFDNVTYWRPEKGAALTTYFIGACKQVFKTAYTSWTKGRDRRWFDASHIAAAPWLDPNYARSFTGQVAIEETIRQVFDLAKPGQKPILGLLYQGYSQVEAATALGITPRAVEGRMYQLRKQVLLAVAAGRITPPNGFTAVPSHEQSRGPVNL